MTRVAPALESPIYEMIGVGHSTARRADVRVEARIHRALGHVDGILLNVTSPVEARSMADTDSSFHLEEGAIL